MGRSTAATLSVLVFTLACSQPTASDDGQTTTTRGATESGEPSDTTTTEASETDESEAEATDETDEGTGFVVEFDYGGLCSISELSVCDEIAQDCPEGEKCIPYLATEDCSFPKCVEITGDKPAGEPCTVDAMGNDDCDVDSWCYPGTLDLELPSVCISFCQGTADDSHCDDPSQVCMSDRLHYQGVLGCRPSCDPLMPQCESFERCTLEPYVSPSLFGCVIGGGVANGEVCGTNQQCDSGACVEATQLLDCEGEGCCAPWCDLMAPDCAMGLECVPVDVDDPDSTVGVCALP